MGSRIRKGVYILNYCQYSPINVAQPAAASELAFGRE
jgi:hypothetical protein